MLLNTPNIDCLYLGEQAGSEEVLFDSWLRKTFKSAKASPNIRLSGDS
jgi:hypothetical protein